MKPQELANIIYSYDKAENAVALRILTELKPTVIARLESSDFNPRELCQLLMAYSNNDLVEDLLPHFENEFKQRYEAMNPEDVSKYYHCFTRANRYGSGHFYKYI